MASEIPTPGVIVGGGRIGNLLYELNDKKDVLLNSRDDSIPTTSGPIYICTRNNDLDEIIAKTPENQRENLIFLQNGMLTNYLESKGLADNTQALIYFAVSKLGEKPIDGKTDLNPEGLTAVTGKWASDFAARLKVADLSCHNLDKETWTIAMLEKHIWICAFMAVGAKYGCNVGEVESRHTDEIREMIRQLGVAATGETGVQFPDGLEDRLCAYARSVAHFPTALKEFEWRNGWFLDITLNESSKERQDPCPAHTQILSDQNLLFKGRKAFIQKRKIKAGYLMQQMKQERQQELQQDSNGFIQERSSQTIVSPTISRVNNRVQ